MSKLQEIRHFYRYQIRNEDITRKRADIRNLMLSALYADQNNCFLCTHHWVFSEPNPNIISLLAQIFNHQNICPAHAEPFFSKILELLFAFP